jgi:hypothetical protein
MRRRDFITVIGAALAAWSFSTHAEEPGQHRRISLLMLYPEKDPQGELRAQVLSFAKPRKLGVWPTSAWRTAPSIRTDLICDRDRSITTTNGSYPRNIREPRLVAHQHLSARVPPVTAVAVKTSYVIS